MKLLAFLGTGGLQGYQRAIYRWNGSDYDTEYVQEAFAHWLQPEETCIVLTQGARAKHWDALRLRLEPCTQVRAVDIPDGRSEAELWDIFDAICEVVQEGDEIAFDITHGFRSLPMIAMLTIAYLKQVKGVQVRYVLYGAYEARDANNVAPVFDLTPFAALLDWLAAAKMFIATGDARELGRLSEQVQNIAYREQGGGSENLPRTLKNFGNAAGEVSESLLLTRIPRLPETIRNFTEQKQQAQAEVQQWARPLAPLLDRMAAAYQPFQENALATHAALIQWYFENNHVAQAVLLAREWVISYYLHQQMLPPDQRQAAEDALNERAKRHASDPLTKLWSRVRDVRNDLAHCGFGRAEGQALSASNLRRNAVEIVQQIREMAQTGS
ncbi:MAG: TIGR02221 family CRISPR-associated protein [Fimbriimonadales bacterium]|nr:MAG: hypothetical protein KatS3mg018_1546 [Fimbriimonadales bacterium]